ncbi:MAG: hypothetical protein ACLGH4_03155 [Actinomycetes bacterium]
MLGPLPTIHRVVVCVFAFLAFVGLGVWLAWLMPESTLASAGTSVGAGLGIVVVLLLLRDNRDHRGPSHARVRTPRS